MKNKDALKINKNINNELEYPTLSEIKELAEKKKEINKVYIEYGCEILIGKIIEEIEKIGINNEGSNKLKETLKEYLYSLPNTKEKFEYLQYVYDFIKDIDFNDKYKVAEKFKNLYNTLRSKIIDSKDNKAGLYDLLALLESFGGFFFFAFMYCLILEQPVIYFVMWIIGVLSDIALFFVTGYKREKEVRKPDIQRARNIALEVLKKYKIVDEKGDKDALITPENFEKLVKRIPDFYLGGQYSYFLEKLDEIAEIFSENDGIIDPNELKIIIDIMQTGDYEKIDFLLKNKIKKNKKKFNKK